MENLYQYGVFGCIVVIVALMYYIVRLKSIIIGMRERKEKLLTEAYFHPVTNLPNKKNIMYVFEEQIGRTLRHNKSFTVLALKINNYEKVKETSIELSEEYLYEASNIIVKGTRDEDLVAHVAEDTFIILFNEYLEDQNNHVIIERLQKCFLEAEFQKTQLAYDVSMGVSTYPTDGTDSEVLIRKAILEAESKQF